MGKRKQVIMRESNEQIITPGGLAMVGALLEASGLYEAADSINITQPRPEYSNSDIVGSYAALLCQGKNDFEAVNELREDNTLYSAILGIGKVPSPETIRQRLDHIAPLLPLYIRRSNIAMLQGLEGGFGKRLERYVPLDLDVACLDNDKTKKEGVSRTYKGYDGFAPIFANMGTEGYLINTELRPGSQHGQEGTPAFLTETIHFAQKLTGDKLLLRSDSGFDAKDNIKVCVENGVDLIIKRNLRQENPYDWLEVALEGVENGCATVTTPREGKTVWIGSTYRYFKDMDCEMRIVYEVIGRTIDAKGQILLYPELEVNTWWTTLFEAGHHNEPVVTNEEVINEYRDHATSEQFHAEIKSDLGLERLPSGKFATNAAILLLAMLAYNILRMMGQASLKKNDAPLKRPVKRRRIKTVIQNLVTFAARVVRHGRQIYFNLGNSNAWRYTFMRVYAGISG